MSVLPSGFATWRDLLSFGLGAGVLIYAIAVRHPPPDPLSIGVGVALVGLPPVAAFAGGKAKRDETFSR